MGGAEERGPWEPTAPQARLRGGGAGAPQGLLLPPGALRPTPGGWRGMSLG